MCTFIKITQTSRTKCLQNITFYHLPEQGSSTPLKFNSLTLCAAGSLRLQGGRSKLDGTVEVYLNGVWGTICGNGWDDRDAAVLCRQLGQG